MSMYGKIEHVEIVRHVSLDELKTMIREARSKKDLTDAQREHVK